MAARAKDVTANADRTSGITYPHKQLLIGVLGIATFSGLTFLGANIRIPLQPVPITLQTLFVLLAGAVLGSSRGTLSEAIYITAGAIGLPVFAGHTAGLSVIAGPTGGYIVGFIFAPLLIGRLMQDHVTFARAFLIFSLGTLVILVLGTLHLTIFYTHSLSRALQVGVLPFIPGDILKIFAASSIYRSYCVIVQSRRK